MILRELPFLRLLMPFVSGMALESFLLPGGAVGSWFVLFGLLLLPLGLVLRSRWPFGKRHFPGLIVAVFLFGWGCLWSRLFSPQASPLSLRGRVPAGEVEMAGIAGAGEDRGKYWRLDLDLRVLRQEAGKIEPLTGRVLVYLPKAGGGGSIPGAGDTLLLRGRLLELEPPANPEAFDFRAYQAGRGVYHQLFADTGAWQLRRRPLTSGAFGLNALINGCRQRILTVLRRHLPGSDEQAIAAALLIGKREEIDPELKEAYAASGAIHVLAVSGLHVGIVFLGLGFLLDRLPLAGPWWRRFRALLLLAGVWSFVLLAGAPPSAVRAGCMFSLFIIGYSLYRTANIFNTIAAAAFVSLCFDPSLLKAVGFQLSYTAVAGIVTFQAPLYRLWYCPWRPVDYLWKLLTVAIAAQLGTFPLSLYYFHQFPLFFWLSGWVAVPAAALILGMGIGLLILDPVPVAGTIAGKLLSVIVSSLNAVIRWIESLPGGLIEGLWIELPGLWWGYAWVFLLARLIKYPVAANWYLFLATTATGFALRAEQHWHWHRQQQLVVYQLRGNSLIDLIAGRQGYRLTSEPLSLNDERWAARNYRWSRGVRKICPLLPGTIAGKDALFRAGSVICFAGRIICMVDGKGALPRPPPEVDYLIVCNDPPVAWLDRLGLKRLGVIIIDDSNNRRSARSWKAAAADLETACWDVRQQGAFVGQVKGVFNF